MKKIVNLYGFILFISLLFTACSPALGNSWYKRSSSGSSRTMYITELKVAGNAVTPFLTEAPKDEYDKVLKFSSAEVYLVNVPYECEEISAGNIEFVVVSSLTQKKPMDVLLEVKGDGVPLSVGKPCPVIIKIKDGNGLYGAFDKTLKVTRQEAVVVQKDLELIELKIHEVDATSGEVTLPYSKASVSAGDISAKFRFGEDETVIPVELESSIIELKEGDTVPVKIMVAEKTGQYNSFEKTVNVARAQKAADEDSALELQSIQVLGIDASGGTISIFGLDRGFTANDITADFKTFGIIDVVLENAPVSFNSAGVAVLNISVPAKQGSYQEWKKSIRVIKDETLEPFNPKDPAGNFKYKIKVKTITEEIDPFDYYKEDYGFDGAKFDSWVVNMPSMIGTIASYKFREGTWNGTSPEQCDNQPDSIGQGLKSISNVKCYRYKTRAARWAQHHGYDPHLTEKEAERQSRFYFYRFTANAAMSIKLDNSMFCVDKNTKFLFYYSDPKEISSLGVPSDWRDYEEESAGSHEHFDEPFYMSDPVGYVEENGSVVMYQWIKSNIEKNKYGAQKNNLFTKQAEKRAGGEGFSPYRNKITKTKAEMEKTENPDYTAAKPEILRQPKTVRIPLTGNEEALFSIKVASVPEGENLTFQWYKNNEQSYDGGVPIDEGKSAYFTYPKTEETDCYIYCVVTNTNSSEHSSPKKTETTNSDIVKLLIKDGSLLIDAEKPEITGQPEGKVVPIRSTAEITLSVTANSIDGGVLSYQWYENTAESTVNGTIIDGQTEKIYKFAPDTSAASVKYYYCAVTNRKEGVNGNPVAERISGIAKVEVEEAYKVNFTVAGEGGYLTAFYKGKLINPGSYVKKGETVKFIAEPLSAWFIVKEWIGVEPKAGLTDKTVAELKMEDSEVTVTVSFEKKAVLTVTPKIYNESLQSWSTAGWSDHMDPKYINGAHFAHDLKITVNNSEGNEYVSQWKYEFPIEGSGNGGITGGGHGEYVKERDFVNVESFKDDSNLQPVPLTENISSFADLSISLQNHLTKSNRHDHWRSDATFGTFLVPAPKAFPKQPLDEGSVFKLVFDEASGKWSLAPGAVNNFPEGVTVSYTQDFSLGFKEEKNFEIIYTVDRHEETRSAGKVKVIYTISWKPFTE